MSLPCAAERLLVGDEERHEAGIVQRVGHPRVSEFGGVVRPLVERLAGWAAVPSPALVQGLPQLAGLVAGLDDDAVVTRKRPDRWFWKIAEGHSRRSCRSATFSMYGF